VVRIPTRATKFPERFNSKASGTELGSGYACGLLPASVRCFCALPIAATRIAHDEERCPLNRFSGQSPIADPNQNVNSLSYPLPPCAHTRKIEKSNAEPQAICPVPAGIPIQHKGSSPGTSQQSCFTYTRLVRVHRYERNREGILSWRYSIRARANGPGDPSRSPASVANKTHPRHKPAISPKPSQTASNLRHHHRAGLQQEPDKNMEQECAPTCHRGLLSIPTTPYR